MADPELTDAEAREIARRMLAEAALRPNASLEAADNATALDAPRGSDQSRSSADEDRIERALVELGAVPPDAASDAEPA